MHVMGIDFTSSPSRRKPLTCLHATFADGVLHANQIDEWPNFAAFEDTLRSPGPWIAGIDFPFGQSRMFVQNVGWPTSWSAYVSHVRSLSRKDFRAELDAYRAARSFGDKEHRRKTDIAAGSISPQKLYGVPVGLMFFEGAPRLLEAKVLIPGVQEGDRSRIVVEAYPGTLARRLIGRRGYKQDTKKKQTTDQREARLAILDAVLDGTLQRSFGFKVHAKTELADDPCGDHLDALLCAIQAAWAWSKRSDEFGAPSCLDPLEGWIADPNLARSIAINSGKEQSPAFQ